MPIAISASDSQEASPLRIAICGAGPGGLAAAIALRQLANVEVTLYDQATELREVGAGIRIGYNSWRVLEELGVAEKVHGHPKVIHEHRDGVTGELQYRYPPHYGDPKYQEIRARRTVLQAALLSAVPKTIIQLRKRLVRIEALPKGGNRLIFDDDSTADADLIVGADGLRSAVRQSVVPGHKTAWNGTTIWRCLVPLDLVKHLSLVNSTCFHHGPNTNSKCSLVSNADEIAAGKGLWELTLKHREDPSQVKETKFSWGVPATTERVAKHFTAFTPEHREAIQLVPDGLWKEFSAFSGPRLDRVAYNNNTLLIGDASHPLLGAFGSGAGFAMQDDWLLAQIIQHFQTSAADVDELLTRSLELFDSIRSPYYAKMYDYLDGPKNNIYGKGTTLSPDPAGDLYWIYGLDIRAQWEEIERALLDTWLPHLVYVMIPSPRPPFR